MDLVEEGVDIEIRVGDDIQRIVSHGSPATNRRICVCFLDTSNATASQSLLVRNCSDCLMIQEKTRHLAVDINGR